MSLNQKTHFYTNLLYKLNKTYGYTFMITEYNDALSNDSFHQIRLIERYKITINSTS